MATTVKEALALSVLGTDRMQERGYSLRRNS